MKLPARRGRRGGVCCRRRADALLLGKHGSRKEKERVPLGLGFLLKLRRAVLEKNHKSERQSRQQNQPDNESEQDPHGKNPGLISKPRRNDPPGGIA